MPTAKSKNKKRKQPPYSKLLVFTLTLGILTIMINMSVWAIKHNQIKIIKESLAASPSETRNLNIEEEKKFWEELTITHPTFKWSYIRLSEIAKEEGNLIKYSEYKQKAFEIDPN